jgi:hypothetical protein
MLVQLVIHPEIVIGYNVLLKKKIDFLEMVSITKKESPDNDNCTDRL